MNIGYSDHYVYLGGHFTDDGKMISVIKYHAADCVKHVNKFATFMNRNTNMPFYLKKKVLDAAIVSAILYSCETWLTNNVQAIAKHYMSAVKLQLGVRNTTTNILCLIEIGYPELDSLIMKRRLSFITQFKTNSSDDVPLAIVLKMCQQANTRAYRFLENTRNYIGDPVLNNISELKIRCTRREESSSKCAIYIKMNPELVVHDVYENSTQYTPDHLRVSFSRFRLSSHNLRVELGRWTRTPREERRCTCELAHVQDESHVTFRCPLTSSIRSDFNIHHDNWTLLFEHANICRITHEILSNFT
jgi:hypothetical protein